VFLLAILAIIAAVLFIVLGKKKKAGGADGGNDLAELRAKASSSVAAAFQLLTQAKTEMSASKRNPGDTALKTKAIGSLRETKTAIANATEAVNRYMKVKNGALVKSKR
jgi:hypothetical protein